MSYNKIVCQELHQILDGPTIVNSGAARVDWNVEGCGITTPLFKFLAASPIVKLLIKNRFISL